MRKLVGALNWQHVCMWLVAIGILATIIFDQDVLFCILVVALFLLVEEKIHVE